MTKNKNEGGKFFQSLTEEEQEQYILDQLRDDVPLPQLLDTISPSPSSAGFPVSEGDLFENYIKAVESYLDAVEKSDSLPLGVKEQAVSFKSTLHLLAQQVRDMGLFEKKKEE